MTDFYADYIKKTTFDPETHSVRSKLVEHHEKDENGKVIEHPIEESTIESLMTLDEYYGGGSMSGMQGRSYQRQYGPKSSANPHNHEAHAKAAFKSGMRSKSAIIKHVEKKTGEKIHPDVHKMVHNSPGMKEAVTKNSSKNQHTKTPEMSVAPTEIPEKKKLEKEELHGNQDKLDHNKDNKIDSADMKMVRKVGAVKEKKSMATLRNRSSMDAMDKMSKMGPKNEKPKMNKRDFIKVKSEEAEIEEGTFRVNVTGLPTMHITGSSAGEFKQSLRKMLKDP